MHFRARLMLAVIVLAIGGTGHAQVTGEIIQDLGKKCPMP